MAAQLDFIGRKLKEARTTSGLTQDQVSEVVGITKASLSYYENGVRKISITLLERLASLYGYTLDYFLKSDTVAEPDFAIAYRAEGISGEDLKTIMWAKTFLDNLCELKEME